MTTREAVFEEVGRAEARIRPHIRETPLEDSPALTGGTGGSVRLKLENLQHTGSFKARGALNRTLCLNEQERVRGVVAASTGNHGAAVAHAAQIAGIRGIVFVPEGTSPAKLDSIRRLGAETRIHGTDSLEAELTAREYARSRGMTYISPYNDLQVVAGQGTLGSELARQAGAIDALFVSVGGGGLIGGVAAYLKTVSPATRVIGCSPVNSCVMAESVKAGRVLELGSKPTLSDGTAGGVEQGSITFGLCRDLVDEWVLVTEEEIAAAMRLVMEAHHVLVEGAAGVAVAACMRHRERLADARAVVVLCGANISLATLKSIL